MADCKGISFHPEGFICNNTFPWFSLLRLSALAESTTLLLPDPKIGQCLKGLYHCGMIQFSAARS